MLDLKIKLLASIFLATRERFFTTAPVVIFFFCFFFVFAKSHFASSPRPEARRQFEALEEALEKFSGVSAEVGTRGSNDGSNVLERRAIPSKFQRLAGDVAGDERKTREKVRGGLEEGNEKSA